MSVLLRAVALAGLVALGGCGSTVRTATFGTGPVATPGPAFETLQQPTVAPAQVNAAARAMTDVSGFLDAKVVPQLSASSRDQAAGAQYNALQFGRPGAPRNWQGDKGASGQVTVGPYVRVNNIDCRDYTHAVTVAGQTYSRSGTACRETDGHWSSVAAPNG